jgi:hypothetical protein
MSNSNQEKTSKINQITSSGYWKKITNSVHKEKIEKTVQQW